MWPVTEVVGEHETLADAIGPLKENALASAPVRRDGGRLEGTLLVREAIAAADEGRGQADVASVARADATVPADAEPEAAIKAVQAQGVNRLPVTEAGTIVGMVSQGDLHAVTILEELDIPVDRISRTISPDDKMFVKAAASYLFAGVLAMQLIRQCLAAVGTGEVRRVLDFGCGHGRVLRVLRAAYPDAELVACDVDRDAVSFCAETFGAQPVLASREAASLSLEGTFDLIWSGSVLTHLDPLQWEPLLSMLAGRLAPGGAAVVTVNGGPMTQVWQAGRWLYSLPGGPAPGAGRRLPRPRRRLRELSGPRVLRALRGLAEQGRRDRRRCGAARRRPPRGRLGRPARHPRTGRGRARGQTVTVERPAPDPDATTVVRQRLHSIARLEEILPAIQSVAAKYEGVYLVGGAVRDVLLGEQSLDLDVMVEGDAIALGRDLAQALGGHSHPHEQFHTAVVKGVGASGREVRVDLASARTETYDAPGALPEVERSTLRHDLARRDFTINAMAASLRPDDLGATYDFFGGYRDLRQETVRVLHDLSFVEDPTRVLRAIRYEARFGFRLDPQTELLARGCADRGLLAELSSTRVRDELVDLLAEERALAALRRMAELGVDRALHPRIDAAAAAVYVEAADREMHGALAEARAPLVRLACLCAEMTERDAREWLDRLKFNRHDRNVVIGAVTRAPAIAAHLSTDAEPALSELYAMLEDDPLEVLVMAIVRGWEPALVAGRIRTYLAQARGAHLEITGDDLQRAGVPESPQIGAALKRTLAMKLDGAIEGRDQELATALAILGRDAG